METVNEIINLNEDGLDKDELAFVKSRTGLLTYDYKNILSPYFRFVKTPRLDNNRIKIFLASLNHQNFFNKVELCEYSPFKIDEYDLMWLVFMSYSDYCVDELGLTPAMLFNSLQTHYQGGVDAFISLPKDVQEDLDKFIAYFGDGLTDYFEDMYSIVKKDIEIKNKTMSLEDVLTYRLESNWGLMLGLKRTRFDGLTMNETQDILISFFTFFTFFDDVEDYMEDIGNGTPTYISRLYETLPYDTFVRTCNLILYMTFIGFIKTLEKYNKNFGMGLDIFKSFYFQMIR